MRYSLLKIGLFPEFFQINRNLIIPNFENHLKAFIDIEDAKDKFLSLLGSED